MCVGGGGAAVSETSSGWEKYAGNPVMGGQYGTCFDVSVLQVGGIYRMWLSWRPQRAIALVESKDGIHWSEPPQIVLGPRKETGWEDAINRPSVLKREDGYRMWYTGQAKGHSWIGYATSPDGIHWKRMSGKPVLLPDQSWEKPYAIFAGTRWLLWYNGRHDRVEQIGLVFHEGGDLGFDR
jgi:beta-1,2-mannobiose phosphorylase / 1,2-beta-oligomannan phosphorylase